MAKLGVTILPWPALHVELDEHKIKLARVDNRHFMWDLSLCWHDTQLLSNAVQKVKSTILEVFELLARRPEWAANGRVPRSSPRSKARRTSRGEPPNLITVRSNQSVAQTVNVVPQLALPNWKRRLFALLILAGLAAVVYLAIALLQLLVLRTPVV